MMKILILGTGKMGTAISTVFRNDYEITSKNSSDFDAADFEQVKELISAVKPDILINTVALLGIDPCEHEPERALKLNTLYPRHLAELARDQGFILVHFSTDAVFNDRKGDYYTESDVPGPTNLYGFTKFGGDCFVQDIAEKHYVFRIPILFGETDKGNQFVEKMLKRASDGHKELKISADIVSSPSYAKDIAGEVKRIIEEKLSYGVYHLSNDGKASLYDLMCEIVNCLDLDIDVQKASHKDFAAVGRKNTYTPIRSEKVAPMRSWKDAVRAYCTNLEKCFRKEK